MIESALTFLRTQINRHLQQRLEITDDMIVIDNVVTQSGDLNATELCLTLISVEEEKVHKVQNPYQIMEDGSVQLVNPQINLNLYVLVSANFGENNYGEALRFLSYVIGFFQSHQVFNHQNAPLLDEDIDKLIMELYTLSFEQQNHLWGCIGAKYMPSVLYKVRMVIINENIRLQQGHDISTITTNLSST